MQRSYFLLMAFACGALYGNAERALPQPPIAADSSIGSVVKDVYTADTQQNTPPTLRVAPLKIM